jgi:translation initiation factor 1 (eIF-1/SUI1)
LKKRGGGGASINLGNGIAKHNGVVKQQGTKRYLVLGFMQSKGVKQIKE